MAEYTLQQLADEAAVTPRTIRYYIAQGLLPSPGAGSGARYTDIHLERLRLIRQLQKSHLPLAEIRTQLARGSALDYVQSVLGRPAGQAGVAKVGSMFALPVAPAAAWRPVAPPTPQPDRSQWDRIALSPDVELHIRRPLTRDQNRRVDRLIVAAREALAEGEER